MKGEVTLQVTPTYKYGYLQAPYDDPIRVVKAIKGKTDLTIDLQSDARLVEVKVGVSSLSVLRWSFKWYWV